jgi:hypothetical protein
MIKKILLLLALLLPITSLAQIQIGDIKVESLASLFDKENKSYWNNEVVFNNNESKIWIADLPSMIVGSGDVIYISLAVKKELKQDSVRTYLINQLNEQFGEFEETEAPPMMNFASLDWTTEEEGKEYIFSLSQDESVEALFITKK